jgi:hypothetical protein
VNRKLLAGVALALALAPALVDAHIEQFTQAKPVSLGPYNGVLRPKPEIMFANTALSMTAIFSRSSDGTLANVPATLELVSPTGEAKRAEMKPDGTGYVVASIAVFDPGNYTARVIVKDDTGEYSNATTFSVYPDLPVRFRSDPNQSDPLVGRSFPIVIQTVDPVDLTPKDAFTDLTLTLERWTDDHTRILDAESLPLNHAGAGLWKADHTFPIKGMYHLRFSSLSGGFKPDDVPILHVYALDPPPGSNPTPLPPGALLAALVAAALLLAPGQRRR